MADISVRELIEAGAHFGHKAKRWNPKMKPYIYGVRNGIHIIDLQQTVELVRRACKFVADTAAKGEEVLFVGTKHQAQDIIAEHGARAKMPYVRGRWLGGTITNFRTIKSCNEKLRNMEKLVESPEFAKFPKKESARIRRELEKLSRNLGGIKDMTKIPGALFVIDPKTEKNSVSEARKLNIPVIAVTDTNCDPGNVNFLIPANDDAMRSINLLTSRVADACIEGAKIYEERLAGKEKEVAAVAEEKEKVEEAAYEIVFKEDAGETGAAKVEEKIAAHDRRIRPRPMRRREGRPGVKREREGGGRGGAAR